MSNSNNLSFVFITTFSFALLNSSSLLANGKLCSSESVKELFEESDSNSFQCNLLETPYCYDNFGNSLLWKSIVERNYLAANQLLDCKISTENEKDPIILALASDFGRDEEQSYLIEDINLLRRLTSLGLSGGVRDFSGNSARFLIVDSVCKSPPLGGETYWHEILKITSSHDIQFFPEENEKVENLRLLSAIGLTDGNCLDILLTSN